jgi:tellurite methyltransferase
MSGKMKRENPYWERYYNMMQSKPPSELLMQAISLSLRKEFALDLGCGAGNDTKFLLEQGFEVTAIDKDLHAIRRLLQWKHPLLHVIHSSFEDADLLQNKYDLVNAQLALPFNPPETFVDVFTCVKGSMRSGGIFTGHFLGIHDAWNKTGNVMTFLTRQEVEQLLQDLHILFLEEKERDRFTMMGPKHWHVFEIIAQRAVNSNLEKL